MGLRISLPIRQTTQLHTPEVRKSISHNSYISVSQYFSLLSSPVTNDTPFARRQHAGTSDPCSLYTCSEIGFGGKQNGPVNSYIRGLF
jgi:hypothetical protein